MPEQCDKLRKIYKFFHSHSSDFGPVKIENTKCSRGKDGISLNSFSFAQNPNETTKECIERVFNIDLSHIDDKKIDRRTRVVHSSALAALICFFDISHKKPLNIKGIEEPFTKMVLEYPNHVAGGGPSKIDLAFFNEKEDVVLFLEAKFKEYITDVGPKKLEDPYKVIYQEQNFSSILPKELELANLETSEEHLTIKSRNESQYCEGIKQMICHYIGSQNYLTSHPECKHVYLGELLFDFPYPELHVFLKNYSNLYSQLAHNLNKVSHSNRLTFLKDVITYQDVLFANPYLLSKKVKVFYGFKSKIHSIP